MTLHKLLIYLFVLKSSCLLISAKVFKQGIDADVVYKWTKLDFKWLHTGDKQNAIRNGSFIVENNIITGIKVYSGRIFVTVPRWRPGVPSTLNEVMNSSHDRAILNPFPSWDMQKIGDCDAFQYVQSMEIDPNTGQMWIIDTGSARGGTTQCNAKIVIYDLKSNYFIRKHLFPDSVVSKGTNFLNDIVIDYVHGKPKFAYISDTGKVPKIVVYDYENDESYFFNHKSMYPENGHMTIISNDGIAMSPDFQYVYYCALADLNLYRIPTKVLRERGNFSQSYQYVGRKSSPSDGMTFSQIGLYVGALTADMVYKESLESLQGGSINLTEVPLFSQPMETLEWVDTFCIDEDGNLWFVANSLVRFFTYTMRFKNTENANMRIWKVNIGEQGYLWRNTNMASKHQIYYHILIFMIFMIKFSIVS
ncbi:protein yellow-like [Mytilus californianus]|uniref:protein yellow-like n=1 Tax=Mytilus californianus TaxID=6549 RepID=UPI002246A6D9|nr:protein yellow-like [Mytilus californianus]